MGRRQRVDARCLPSTSTPQGRHDCIVGSMLAYRFLKWRSCFGILCLKENSIVNIYQLP